MSQTVAEASAPAPIVYPIEEKSKARAGCTECHGAGKVICKNCQGKGFTECSICGGSGSGYGGLGECYACQSSSNNNRCAICNATGKTKCSCAFDYRVIWKDSKEVLGHKAPVLGMAEKNGDMPWEFSYSEDFGTTWIAFSATEVAASALDRAMDEIAKRVRAKRQKILGLLEQLHDDDLNEALEHLETLLKKP